nr:unnamed protein product [Callosobruchus analis]
MTGHQKISEEERKRIKRERERERRRKIKEDPKRREEQREKEHQKYLRQRQNKQRKVVSEMTNREVRSQRKKWRKYTRSHRERLKDNSTDTLDNLRSENGMKRSDGRKEYAAKRNNRMKVERHREKLRREATISDLRRNIGKWKKKYSRLKASLNKNKDAAQKPESQSITPEARVQQIMENSLIQPQRVEEVKKQLLFGEAIKDQLLESYKSLRPDEKRVFKKIMDGQVLKKYKLQTACAKVFRYKKTKLVECSDKGVRITYKKKLWYFQRISENRRKIEAFLQEDVHSRICPGKKDYVTKNKVTCQKRFLTNTLKNLFKEYCNKYPDIKVSYTFFCRCKPFWIKFMKVASRDTCQCMTHSNMELIVDCLWQNKVLPYRTSSQIVGSITCENRNVLCLLRKCSNCALYKLKCDEKYDSDKVVSYYQWKNVKQTYFNKRTKNNQTCLKIAKVGDKITISDLFCKFESKLTPFLAHEGRILHQYNTIKTLKQNLAEKEVLIHCDFSENYNLKYSQEVQSYHFGGSRQQISLHTVVVYSRVPGQELKVQSFCTLSESLEHGPGAIWAHLYPLVKRLIDNEIKVLHFLSDSPSTQYRNKKMFAFITNQMYDYFPEVQSVTWNYHEAGHGKGAPDGIGGVCKRTADRIVAEGTDVSCFDKLVEVLKANCPGIVFFEVYASEIEKFSDTISKGEILPFRGTMKVRQIKSVRHSKTLSLRELSCFRCEKKCVHFHIGSLTYSADNVTSSSESDEELFSIEKGSQAKLYYHSVYSDSSSDDDVPLSELRKLSLINRKSSSERDSLIVEPGTYVIVNIKPATSRTSNVYRYVALCEYGISCNSDGSRVTFLRECHDRVSQLFRLEESDKSYVTRRDIIEILPMPHIVKRGKRIYYKFPTKVNVFQSA